jgi:hypothetical protein
MIMKMKVILPIIITLLVVLVSINGCQSSGISANEYNDVIDQLQAANDQISELWTEKTDLESAKETVEDDLEDALATISELQVQISGMVGQSDLTGENTLETVINIIEYYHDTHMYSKSDLFVCSDMSMEVWNMLQARGIKALIVVGDIETLIDDILLSTHAWVLAEIEENRYLALETTGGYVVYNSENDLYYKGWYFKNPADMKSYNELVKEYNVRVSIINQIIVEDQAVVDEHNSTTNPTEAAKLKAIHEMLDKLITSQEADLIAIEEEINGLASRCSA